MVDQTEDSSVLMESEMELKNVMMAILMTMMVEVPVVSLSQAILVQEVMHQIQILEYMFLHPLTQRILQVLILALMNLGNNMTQPRNHHSPELLHQ